MMVEKVVASFESANFDIATNHMARVPSAHVQVGVVEPVTHVTQSSE